MTPMNPDTVRALVAGHSMIRDIDKLPKGHLRIETAFTYPDGSSIEVFVPKNTDLFPERKLSDLGQTMELLLTMQVRPWTSKKRAQQLDDAIRPYGVKLNGAALEIAVPSDEQFSHSLVRLSQACLRVSDLLFTRRTAIQSAFAERVEEVLSDAELKFKPNAELEGRFGKLIRVDFLVSGAKTKSAVLTLPAAPASQSHGPAVEVFRKWFDLAGAQRDEQRLTIYDDQQVQLYKTEDLRRLEEVSVVIGISDPAAVVELIAA